MKMKFSKNRIWVSQNREIKSLICLIGLIGILIFMPILMEKFYFNSFLSRDTRWLDELKSDSVDEALITNPDHKAENVLEKPIKNIPLSEAFYFDPNSASFEIWKKFDLKDYKIRRIQKYLSKGGHFYRKTDIEKIYGLDDSDIRRIEPHIGNLGLGKKSRMGSPYRFRSQEFRGNRLSGYKISLNKAGFQDFLSLKGIHPREIWDILNFRKRNGPFSDIRELKNLKILDISTYNRIEKELSLN